MKDAVDILNQKIEKLEAECNDLAHQLNECNERGGRVLAENKRLIDLLKKMQSDVQNYLYPGDPSADDAWLINRLIYWLDGPEQREAMKCKKQLKS